MSTVHDVAKAGFGTGTNELYDRARPSYPPEALEFMRSNLSQSKTPLSVVEIGSGTGIFTRALLAHPAWKVLVQTLRAVEPSEGMRSVFLQKTQDPRVSCDEGTFTQTNESDESADVLFIAQAFHWAHPNYDEAMKEIARVLKPDGVAFFIWNMEDRQTGWVAKVRDLYEAYEEDTPQFRLNKWEATFQTPSYLSHFDAPVRFETEWHVPTTITGVQERVLSKSYITQIPPEAKSKLAEEIEATLRESEKAWIQEEAGIFEYPYKTTVIAMKKSN
ncbi:SubName: Full=Uncharacterized protein {ECO:0000313/EMBL:CCA66813.1} [Serendipita indica DSM 11827]|nr:SubName: Full=Uncharacterized protein {ECO:0000313/EMBL:CCA66813.1} [Serendipita indica DSM 11827]